jgi:UDPglucose 6-dehydrogenase
VRAALQVQQGDDRVSKKITVIGTGYVGLVAAVGLSDFGHYVTGVDIDAEKIAQLNRGVPVIYEPGIEEYLKRNLTAGRLSFSTDVDRAIRESDLIFIAVGTPPQGNGEADLAQLRAAAASIAANLNGYKVVVTKSTVPVGTNRWLKGELERLTGDGNFDVVSNPEFLREGKAVQDFFHPDRIVIGTSSEKARKLLEEVYRSLYLRETPFVWCSLETAELIKYASNAFLAMKITFINQMAALAEKVGADIHQIARAMGMDGRISAKFLHPGPGYGGSCFPKDTRALTAAGEKHGAPVTLIAETVRANEAQKLRMVEKLKTMTGGLTGKRVAVLGLAFKAETDDVRESPAITIVKGLLDEGAVVAAHDPKAMESFRTAFPNLIYCGSEFEAAEQADALVICTEWNEYRNLDLERLAAVMRGKVLLDTRNLLEREAAESLGFSYQGVGR